VEAIFAIVEKRNFDQTLAQQLAQWAANHKVSIDPKCGTAATVAEIECVRKSGLGEKQMNILKETFFLTQGGDPLFRALAYASVSVTSAHDMNKALNTYELQSNAKHPLFLLAHARLAEKHEDVLLQLALLHEYVRYVPQSDWLSEKEKKLLDMKKLPC
jgi:hypothetical protein